MRFQILYETSVLPYKRLETLDLQCTRLLRHSDQVRIDVVIAGQRVDSYIIDI